MTADLQKISTIERWLKKPGFKKLFDQEYENFLASEELIRSTVFTTSKRENAAQE